MKTHFSYLFVMSICKQCLIIKKKKRNNNIGIIQDLDYDDDVRTVFDSVVPF